MSLNGPGKSHRKGISIIDLFKMFPDDQTAEQWFEAQRWPNGVRQCPDCGSHLTGTTTHKTMPYRCKECRQFFSARKGTVLEGSRIGMQKWVIAIYMMSTALKGTSSMKLHRELDVTQKTAWYMMQRIREGFLGEQDECMSGPVEVDETFVGGKERNKHADKKLRAGRGAVGKTPVVGIKDRPTNTVQANVVAHVDQETLENFIEDHADSDAIKYTDESSVYNRLSNHYTCTHSIGAWVEGQAHTNGLESFWALLKRGYYGVFHHLSPKHLNRYVQEFTARHNMRGLDTAEQMTLIAESLVGKRIRYRDLIAGGTL